MKLISKIVPILLLAAAGANPARADFNPVTLTANSYTYDIVIPSNGPPAAGSPTFYGLTATTGAGTSLGDTSFFEQGMVARAGYQYFNLGIPVHNTVFTNINNANMAFLMPPVYTTNNDLQVDSGNTSGTLYFNNPTAAANLAILCTSGGGGNQISYTLTYTNGATESGSFSIPDWFNGGGQVAWGANARIDINGNFSYYSVGSANNTEPYLYGETISVAGTNAIASITFTYNNGGEANFYAISGMSSGGTTWTPIPVNGFNQLATVPAVFPVTATMDTGTDLGYNGNVNTWFEQGYYQPNPSYGLPPSGSIFASQAYTNHLYQMGNYHTNNAILIDSAHLAVNIVPAAPTNYSSFAFLTAGANIGGNNVMTNICILQHQDGVNETNLFFAYDWYNNAIAPAWVANGRINMEGLTFNTIGDNDPDLFESFFVLADVASPVTNILVEYDLAPGGNSTTFIMAVSAAAGGVAPLVTSGALPATQTWYPTQTATFGVQVTGTAPLTNIWAIQQGVDVNNNPIYVPLSNGLDANGSTVIGANTTTLTISNLSLLDGTNYIYIAANAVGSATSSPAMLIMNTGTPVAPIIDSQVPTASFSVLTNHVDTTTFSLTIDASSAPPFYYQWYNGSTPIPGATGATYANADTNDVTIYCVVTNFVGAATSAPVSISIYMLPPLSPYQAAIFAYRPVAYWPLTETNGNIAFDWASTNDGVYNGNYTLGNAGLPATPGVGPNVSAGFDGSTAYVEVPVGDLNILGPITVIQWVQPPSGADTGFTTTIGHSDQGWRLDVAGGQPHWADAGPDIVSPLSVNDGNWHQLVGVYDGTNQYLYLDGQPTGQILAGSPSGNQDDVRIGGAPDYGNRMFDGNIAQVAVLPVALTAAQVATIYGDLDTAPTVTVTPASPSVYAGTSITLTATLSGTPATSLQWYYIDTLNNSNNIVGATSSTYTIQNTPADYNGYMFGVIAANAYGTNTAAVQISVQDAPAFLAVDLSPLTGEAYTGAPVTYTVNAQGSLPIYYQWYVDSAAVAGATNAGFTSAAQCGSHTYQVSFTNAESGGTPVFSSIATLQGDAYPTNITFNTNGTGWQFNTAGFGSVPTITGNVLELTDGQGGEASSVFYTVPEYVGTFTASFTYIGNGSADGVAFVLQNCAAGAAGLGAAGGGLGYFGITNSVAFEINLYPGNGEVQGVVADTNGLTFPDGGAEYQPTGPVNVTSGHPINITLNWAHGVMAVSLADADTHATYSTNYVLGSLTAILGGSDIAYVGFSGGDGGATSIQTVSNFEFNAVIPPVGLTVSPSGPSAFIISWSAADPSYQLQTSTSLTSPSWVAGPSPTVVGGLDEVTINASTGTGAHFYRLVRVVCQ